MKATNIFWGILAILVAILLILNETGVISPLISAVGEVSVFAIILGIALLSYAISRLVKGKISEIFLPLAFIFMLFEKNLSVIIGKNGEDIISNWLVILIALLLHIGFSILFKKEGIIHVSYTTKHDNDDDDDDDDDDNDDVKHVHAGGSLSSSNVYIDCSTMTPNHIENNLGACNVYFENSERYNGGATIYVENNLGAMNINVPAAWKINASIENNLGSINIPENDDTDDRPVLFIKGENSLGSLNIKYN